MLKVEKDFGRGRKRISRSLGARRGPLAGRRLGTTISGRSARLEALEDRRLLTVVPFASIANQLRDQLGAIETRIVSALDNIATGPTSSLPFVGEQLGKASKAISGFSQQAHAAINALGNLTDPSASVLQNAIFDALGPSGLNLVGDRTGNGVDAGDVVVTAPGGVLNGDFSVQVRLQGTVAAPAAPIGFDLGLAGLPFSIEADGALGINVNFNYELAFSFDAGPNTISVDHNKFLPGTNDQMRLAVTAGLTNFEATARMGFVQGDLTAISGQANGLSLNVGLSGLNTTPQVDVTGSADANLRLSGSFAGTGNDFPGIDTDLHLHWVIDTDNPSAAAPDVWFDNVYLDLGKFLSNVVQPVFEVIQDFTAPLDPVLEVLGYPLPGLSQLSRAIGGDDVDLLDLGSVAALVTGFGPLYDLVHKVLDVIDKINDFELGATVRLPLGGFDLDAFDLRSTPAAGSIGNLSLPNLTSLSPSNLIGVGQSLAAKVDDLPLTGEQKELIKGFAEQLNNGFSINFPILEDPASAVFPMLLGRDSDLFTLDAEMHYTAKGSVATGFSVFGVGIDFGGEVEIDTKFKFAYDTFGLRQVINSIASGSPSAGQIAEDVLKGFYVASDSFFEMAGGVYAGVGASFGIFSAIVGGFVSTGDGGDEPVSIKLNDPNSDGKLRFNEFSEDAIDLSGEFVGELGVEVRIGVEFLGEFVGVKKRFDIAREVLIDFDPNSNNPDDPDNPILASQPDANGNILLYIGPHAVHRVGVGGGNGDEKVTITHVATTEAGETIDVTMYTENILGLKYGVTQRIAGVRSISGLGGLGNLTIDVLPGVTSSVDFDGGAGHAELLYHGDGAARLVAGQLASTLAAGKGDAILIGGPQDDEISLGNGLNTVTGGAGRNTIIVNAPTTQGGTVSGGDSANNSLVVLSSEKTTDINIGPDSPGAIRLSYEERTGGPYPNLVLTHFDTVTISAQDADVDVHVGDLSSGGIGTVVINVPTEGPGGRDIDLDTSATLGATNISITPFEHSYPTEGGGTFVYQAMLIDNLTTGLKTYLLGVADDDETTIHKHGGTTTLGPLNNDNGTIVIDSTVRPATQGESIFMLIPSDDDGNQITSNDVSGHFTLNPELYPTIVLRNVITADLLEIDVAAPTTPVGTNTFLLDASELAGWIDIDLLGDATARHEVTLSELSIDTTLDIHGGTSQTLFEYGTGQLALVLGDVQAHNVELTIDNFETAIPMLLVLGTTALERRTAPDDLLRPSLTYDGLRGTYTVHAGPGDKVGLPQSAPGIDLVRVTNVSDTLDPVYIKASQVDLQFEGNLSLFFGREMLADGTVLRTSTMAPIAVDATAEFTGGTPREIIFDAVLDPPGALWNLGGKGVVSTQNNTVGFSLVATGTKLADDLDLLITGADVNVNLTQMANVEITIDSHERFEGLNLTSPTNIDVRVRVGQVTLTPTGAYDSLLQGGNPVNILATMPQDSLDVSIDSSVSIGVNAHNPGHVIGWGGDFFFADAYYFADAPAGTWPLVTSVEFRDETTYFSQGLLATYPELTGGQLPYGFYSPVTSAGFTYDQVYLDPTAFINPPLPTSATGLGLLYLTNFSQVKSRMDLNASQVRGKFNVSVLDPNYATANRFAEFFDTLTQTGYVRNPAAGGGWSHLPYTGPRYRVEYGETQINLTHVGVETEATVSGVAPLGSGTSYSYIDPAIRAVNQATVYVTLGGGNLSNVAGPVSFDKVRLTIDGRYGIDERIFTLNQSTFYGWTANTSVVRSAGMGILYGTLDIIGSPYDSFSVLQTPTGPSKVVIRNFGPPPPDAMSMALPASGEPLAESMAEQAHTPTVYLAGKKIAQTLEVDGHFEFYIGRKLNPDGSVELLTSVSGFTEFNSETGRDNIITYNFVGEGNGKLVYDVNAHFNSGNGMDILPASTSGPVYPGKSVLSYDGWPTNLIGILRNKVVFSPNTDLSVMAATNSSFTVENPTTATIRYFANPNANPNYGEYVEVHSTQGPVFINGRGRLTRVAVVPLPGSVDDLRNQVLAPVTVDNAALRMHLDGEAMPAPATLANIELHSTYITGMTGAPVYFSNLKDLQGGSGSQSGLHLGMPRHAASLKILGTPLGVMTAINTVDNVPIGDVEILGTNGDLWLGSVMYPSASFAVNRQEFRAASVTVGDGMMQGILGNIRFGHPAYNNYFIASGTVLDNSEDVPRQVVLGGNSNRASVDWTGLAPGGFLFDTGFSDKITILGGVGSHYTINYTTLNAHLMTGVNSTVQFNEETAFYGNVTYGMKVYGAEQVTFYVPPGTSIGQGIPVEIFAHPDRPNDTVDVTVDMTRSGQLLWLDKLPDGRGEIWLDRVDLHRSMFVFPAELTHLTLLTQNETSGSWPFMLTVVDTVALTTTVHPGRRNLNVLATTNPLTINASGEPSSYFTGAHVVLGNAGNMQGLQGPITINVAETAPANVTIEFNTTAESSPRTITVEQLAANEWTVSGLAPLPIEVNGSRARLSMKANASANNTLAAPHLANAWDINSVGGGTVGSVTFAGMRNLVGGSAGDQFSFRLTGQVPGNLDGGDGFDTLRYLNVLTGSETIDLEAGIAPRVTGVVTNVEAVDIVTPLVVQNPGNQTPRVGLPIAPLQIVATGGVTPKTFSATNLPTGLAIDPNTGIISGTLSSSLSVGAVFNSSVTVTDATGAQTVNFSWTVQSQWGIINPGPQLSPEGVPIRLQIQVDNPLGIPLTYNASGLPSGLTINWQTGEITGSIYYYNYYYGQNFTFPVTIFVYDATSQKTISFNWTTQQGFGFDVSPRLNLAGESIDINLVQNMYGHNITVTATGLPAGLSMDASGRITGTIDSFAFRAEPYEVQFVAVNHTIGYTLPRTVQWTVIAPVTLYQMDDQAAYAGSDVERYVQYYNPLGHTLEFAAAGLPAGLSVNADGIITGTIDASAAAASPYQVTVTMTDVTIGYTQQTSFEWQVRPALSVEDLNAGTPPGTPILVDIIDPMSAPSPNDLTPVAYDSAPGTPTYLYFVSRSELYQYDGQAISRVPIIDPTNSSIDGARNLAALPGHGVILSDYYDRLWFADRSGARVISEGPLHLDSTEPLVIGGSLYFIAFEADTFQPYLLKISADGSGTPQLDPIDIGSLNSLWYVQSFAGGIAVVGMDAAAPEIHTLYWHDPASGTTKIVDRSYRIYDLTPVDNAGGAQTLFYYTGTASGTELRAVANSALGDAEPLVTTLATFDPNTIVSTQNYPPQPLIAVGNRVSFSVTNYVGASYVAQFWTSDGTVAGTGPVSPVTSGHSWVIEQIEFAGNVYYLQQYLNVAELLPTTVVGQLWRLDPSTGQVTLLHDFLGEDNSYNFPSSFRDGGEFLYFSGWNSQTQRIALWRIGSDESAPSLVPFKVGNEYYDPSTFNSVVLGDRFYFAARSGAVVDDYGDFTWQLWSVGAPESVTVPGDLDGDGSVTATDIDSLWGLIQNGNAAGDLNGDNAVDQADMDYLVRGILNTQYGDANLDGFVDAADLATTRGRMGTSFGGPNWAGGDFNGDGRVDAADLAVVRRYTGFARPAAEPAAEPMVAGASANLLFHEDVEESIEILAKAASGRRRLLKQTS